MEDDEDDNRWATALAIMLHAVTLQRPAEIIAARREQFDWTPGLETWRIPASQTKTNEDYEVPLSPLAAALFREALSKHNQKWVFPKKVEEDHIRHDGPKQRWIRMRNKLVKQARESATTCPLEGVQLYDCRRLGRTLLVRELGVSPAIAEACINHAPDRSMQARYDVGNNSGEIRRAMELWGEYVANLVGEIAMTDAVNQSATHLKQANMELPPQEVSQADDEGSIPFTRSRFSIIIQVSKFPITSGNSCLCLPARNQLEKGFHASLLSGMTELTIVKAGHWRPL